MKKLVMLCLGVVMAVNTMSAELREGTKIKVKLDRGISEQAYDGLQFEGTTVNALKLSDGNKVPKGTKVYGTVTVVKGKRVVSSDKISLSIKEIEYDEFIYDISSEDYVIGEQDKKKEGRRKVLRRALVGATVGKVTGNSGSKGLAIGAASGAVQTGVESNMDSLMILPGDIIDFRLNDVAIID